MVVFQQLDSELATSLTTILVSIGIVISSCEYLFIYQRFSDDNILSWRVFKSDSPWFLSGFVAEFADYILSYERFKYILTARLICAALLVGLASVGVVPPLLLFVVFAATYLISIRGPYGLDGAHQMYLVITGALFVSSVVPKESIVKDACLWFIALQAVLSYFIAGLYKLISSSWRDGTALVGIFSTSFYGNPFVFSLLSANPTLAKILSWFIIAYECCFPLVLLLDVRVSLFMLVMGGIFHGFNALFMGLNDFVFAWIATYPAVIFFATVTLSVVSIV